VEQFRPINISKNTFFFFRPRYFYRMAPVA
jgi:hypothetical protein